MPKSIIHVNQHIIRANNKKSRNYDPPITVRKGQKTERGKTVQLLGPKNEVLAEFLYRPRKPLSCGARLWLETNLKIKILK